ncbi:hypothetical protein K4K53_011114 [Colletotrichum sp. SAR 10_77]|nr:hypothetical protein K4K53_011114 [Colletotrichum sp. SAR 10_77]
MKTHNAILLAISALASADYTYNQTTGVYTCSRANSQWCAGDSFGTDIIIRCNAQGKGQPGRCTNNLAGEYPRGVQPAQCWMSNADAGDAACEKNCVVYASPQPFLLPPSVCTPYSAVTGSQTYPVGRPTGTMAPGGNELLWSILLPDVAYHSVSHVFQEKAPDVANHDPEFFLRWRKFWRLRTVCRRFNDFLFPLLSHAFRREALSILAATVIVDCAQHELGWIGVIEGCYHPLQSLNQILERWMLDERQRTSFLWNMYVALRNPKHVVTIRDERLILAMNNERAERLVLCAFDDWCWHYREDLLRLGGPTYSCMHWWRGEDPAGCVAYKNMQEAQMQTVKCLQMTVADPLVDDLIKLWFRTVT